MTALEENTKSDKFFDENGKMHPTLLILKIKDADEAVKIYKMQITDAEQYKVDAKIGIQTLERRIRESTEIIKEAKKNIKFYTSTAEELFSK